MKGSPWSYRLNSGPLKIFQLSATFPWFHRLPRRLLLAGEVQHEMWIFRSRRWTSSQLTVPWSDGGWWRLLGLAGKSHVNARRKPLQKGSGIGDHRPLSTVRIRNGSVSYASAIFLNNWGCLLCDKSMQLIWFFFESICLAEDGDEEAFYVFLLLGNPIFFLAWSVLDENQ